MKTKCKICGKALISESSKKAGMGKECLRAYNLAMSNKLYSYSDFSLAWNWTIEANYYRALFLERFKDKRKRFRNDFKKSFYDSILERDRISKKMLSVMKDWLFGGYGYYDAEKEDYHWKNICDELHSFRNDFIKKHKITVNNDEIEIARKKIKNQ